MNQKVSETCFFYIIHYCVKMGLMWVLLPPTNIRRFKDIIFNLYQFHLNTDNLQSLSSKNSVNIINECTKCFCNITWTKFHKVKTNTTTE